jgi:hypothetical protein
MWVFVAVADENLRAIEIPFVILVGNAFANQTSRKSNDTAPPLCMACGKFKGQASTLRKACYVDFSGCQSCIYYVFGNGMYQLNGTGQPRFVLFNGREKGIRIPSIIGGLRRNNIKTIYA